MAIYRKGVDYCTTPNNTEMVNYKDGTVSAI